MNLLRLFVVALTAAVSGGVLSAQPLTVSNAPFAPAENGHAGGADFIKPIAAFRFAADGGDVSVDGLFLTVGGTGDWLNDLDPATGVSVWIDDGDGVFDDTADVEIASAAPASPWISVAFASPVVAPDKTAVDLWIALRVLSTAGVTLPSSFTVEIAGAIDVATSTPGATVVFGSALPRGETFTVADFYVTSMTPMGSKRGAPITLTGNGFVHPITVKLDGIEVDGVAAISPDHTTVTGLVVPNIFTNLKDTDMIVTIETGIPGVVTLPSPFIYDDKSADAYYEDSCSARVRPQRAVSVVLLLLAALAAGRRRRCRS